MTKRILFAAILLLAFALPAFGVARTLNWTDADADEDWTNFDNWIDVATSVAPLAAPATGDTLQFLDGTKTLPASNLPNAGEIFVLVLDGASAGTAWTTKNITAFCGTNAYVAGVSGWTYSSLQIGAAGRNSDIIYLDRDSAALGTITTYGVLYDDGVPTPVVNATITVKSGGTFRCYTTNWAVTKAITVETGGALRLNGVTLLANGGVNLAGTLLISAASSVLDVGTAPLTCTGDATIYWGDGNGVIYGGLNAAGFAVTHNSPAAGNSIICDVAGTLDLGTTAANAIAVTVSASTTIGNSFACGTFNPTAGTLTGAGKTITVGAGGFIPSGTNTIAGTLSVDLSAGVGTGVYTQTAGTIGSGATLNVITGTGAVTFTALTRTGTLNVTHNAASGSLAWDSTTAQISKLTINAGMKTTLTGGARVLSFAGSGELATGGTWFFLYGVASIDFWTFTGTVTGTGTVKIYFLADISNAAAITLANTSVTNILGANTTLALAGKITTAGAFSLAGSSGSAVGTVACNGGSSFGGAVTLGSGTTNGVLTLASGQVHTFASTIARADTGTANALKLGGRVILGGTFTGTGITVTQAGDGQIDCQGTGVVAKVTATGNRLVVRRAVDAAGMPLRSWNGGDTNVNVRFLGRKVIGEPGIQ